MAAPGMFARLRKYLQSSDWILPAFGIAAAAPIVGGMLDKYNRKRYWEMEMKRRYLMGQMHDFKPTYSLPSQRELVQEAIARPELITKASQDISKALGRDPVDDLGIKIRKSKKVKHRTAGYLYDHEEPYTGDDHNHTSRLELGGSPGGGGPNAMSGGG